MPTNREIRQSIEEAVAATIQTRDAQQQLDDADALEIEQMVADEVFDRMVDDMRPVLEEQDLSFIQRRVDVLVKANVPPESAPVRFERFDRVVCRIGGERKWAAGAVMALDVDDPKDPTGKTKLPYVVKIDPPESRLISVPTDQDTHCRAEVCFGRHEGALSFTLCCRPLRQLEARRFGVGDRVVCAVEDASGDFSDWAAGKVVEVNHIVEVPTGEYTPGSGSGPAVVPYDVLLDTGVHVLVHRDEHWLVRDFALQAPGPRQAADGTRNLTRLVKRRAADSSCWELIDHMTRKLRHEAIHSDDDDDVDVD